MLLTRIRLHFARVIETTWRCMSCIKDVKESICSGLSVVTKLRNTMLFSRPWNVLTEETLDSRSLLSTWSAAPGPIAARSKFRIYVPWYLYMTMIEMSLGVQAPVLSSTIPSKNNWPPSWQTLLWDEDLIECRLLANIWREWLITLGWIIRQNKSSFRSASSKSLWFSPPSRRCNSLKRIIEHVFVAAPRSEMALGDYNTDLQPFLNWS